MSQIRTKRYGTGEHHKRIYLVAPRHLENFWSMQGTVELLGAKTLMPNAALATLMALTPPGIDVEYVLCDENVPIRPGLVYYLVYKPVGVVSTASDPQGRPTVVGLVPADTRVYPVGRLDADSEGLIILTNDGDLAAHVAHPRHAVSKTCVARVDGSPGRKALRALTEGSNWRTARRGRGRPAWWESTAGRPWSRW